MKNKTFYITTPIYYPSGNLHIGHVYTTTLAATLANYKKLMGFQVRFLTGSDEHGQKIEQKAKINNVSPKKYVDKMTLQFKELWKKLDIQYDYFSRTTNEKHKKAVIKQFSKLLENGDIYKGTYKGLYSISDEEFMTKTQAKEIAGKFYHPTSGSELKEVEEESYFFKINKYENWWKKYVNENENFLQPKKIIKELSNNFVDKGLENLSVTRSTFKWGIPINEDPKHVIYVWLDALNNYITSLGYDSDNDKEYKTFWKEGDEIVHLVGKEITRFHGIYWPIILKANNLRQPTTILSHGWILTPKGKMSKSKGNVINPLDLLEKYDKEVIKYFFASKIKMSQDGIFDEELLKLTQNSDLANIFGNLLSRVVGMMIQNFDKPIKHNTTNIKEDEEILNEIKFRTDNFKKELDKYNISSGLYNVLELGKKLNGYIDITMPWKLKENKKRLSEVLNNLFNGIYSIFTMLSIVMPQKSLEAIHSLGFDSFSISEILNFKKFDDKFPKKIKPLFERKK